MVPTVWWVILIAALLVSAGATLLIDAWLRARARPDLAERLQRFHHMSIAEQAERWLHKREIASRWKPSEATIWSSRWTPLPSIVRSVRLTWAFT